MTIFDINNTLTTSLERQVEALEKTLNVSVTLHDHQGYWSKDEAFQKGVRPAFGSHRHRWCDHRRLEVTGCDQACMDHCLKKSWIDLKVQPLPRWVECWKGALELQIPIVRENVVLGVMFVGTFRTEFQKPPEPFRDEEEYQSLMVLTPERQSQIYELSLAVAKGWTYLFDGQTSELHAFKGRLEAWLDLHACEDLRLEDLGRQMYLSPSRASRVFKEIFSISFSQLLMTLRVEKSKKLLRNSRLNLSEIAHRMGYDNEYYYGRVFKKISGVSPGKYRKMLY